MLEAWWDRAVGVVSKGNGGGKVKSLNIRGLPMVVVYVMKHLLTLTVTAIAMAAFATTTFAGDGGCGPCPGGGEKSKDKTEEGTQS